jgi:HJR/Mrr/RecB family endonuclease
MKIPNKKNRKDLIVGSIIAIIALLYFTDTSSNLIVDLVMVCLLIAAICYVLIYPLIGAFMDIRSFREFKKLAKLKQSSEEIDTMSWKEFEMFVAKWLKHEGYNNVRITEHYDLGVDIVAEKDGIKWGVQVKHYRNMVKIEAIRQVVVALKHYQCDKAMVVTNSFFSRPAKQLAASHGCILIDGDVFKES